MDYISNESFSVIKTKISEPKPRKTTIKIQEPETKEEGELSEEEEKEDKMELREGQEDESKKRDRVKLTAPLIVDETQRGYDREALFKKLKENKLTKVTLQPIIESKILQEQLTKTLPIATIKKAKKLELSKPLIIEEEEEIVTRKAPKTRKTAAETTKVEKTKSSKKDGSSRKSKPVEDKSTTKKRKSGRK